MTSNRNKYNYLPSESLQLGQVQATLRILRPVFKSVFDDGDSVDVAVVEVAAIAGIGVLDPVTWACWLGVLTVAGLVAVATTCHLLGSLGSCCNCWAEKNYSIKLNQKVQDNINKLLFKKKPWTTK